MGSEIDGRPLSDREILDICVVLLLAGLHTTERQLGYMFKYLAEHPSERHRIVEEPDIIPMAVEEFLRVHPIVLGTGRKVTRDIEFHGCPMKEGDMVMLPLPVVCRSPELVDNPTVVDFDRAVNRHISFGVGPHRCLGNHLARRELAVALSIWHASIPDYRLDGDAPLVERGGQASLVSLPLAWD
jgi:cytochrome P450